VRVSWHAHPLLPQRARRQPGRPSPWKCGCSTSTAGRLLLSGAGQQAQHRQPDEDLPTSAVARARTLVGALVCIRSYRASASPPAYADSDQVCPDPVSLDPTPLSGSHGLLRLARQASIARSALLMGPLGARTEPAARCISARGDISREFPWSAQWRGFLERSYPRLLAEHGIAHLDIGELRSAHRSLSQALAGVLFDEGFAGVVSQSKLTSRRCLAAFVGRRAPPVGGTGRTRQRAGTADVRRAGMQGTRLDPHRLKDRRRFRTPTTLGYGTWLVFLSGGLRNTLRHTDRRHDPLPLPRSATALEPSARRDRLPSVSAITN